MRERGRVLHFIDTTGPGGAETVYLQVADGLSRRGWEPRMVVVGPGWVLDHVRARELPVDVVETSGRLDLSYVLRLRDLIRRHRIDLIHAHLFSPAVYASALGAWTGTPVVATFHGASDTEPGGWGRRLRYGLLSRRAAMACVSEPLRDELLARGVPPGSVRVIHNGADLDAVRTGHGEGLRRRQGVPEDTFLVGALGNVRPAKDYPNLLRAAAELESEERIAIAVAGQRTDPLYSELLALRDRLGLEDRVSFWGFQDDVSAVMDACDLLVISSSSEGFSLAAIQAMAAGVPVVATRSGGPERIITDGEDGLLVPTGDHASLAAAIRRLADDASLRERLAERARETVRSRFSLSAMLDRYEALYEEITTPSNTLSTSRA